MPAFLIHWRVLIETARLSQDAGSDLGSLIIDNAALKRRLQGLKTPPQTTPAGAVWDTGPLPRIEDHFPGSDISAMAFLGALTPDLAGFQWRQFRSTLREGAPQPDNKPLNAAGTCWQLLLHSNRSGDVLLSLLEHIAQIPSPALRSQSLAFCLGYLSHIATDIALNPWLHALASMYEQSALAGLPAGISPHTYVELCLDEYIAATFFEKKRYSYLNQPWGGYIEPVAHDILHARTLAAQVFALFVTVVGTTYSMDERQRLTFYQDQLSGLHRLRLLLAGRGSFLWHTLRMQLRKRGHDPVVATIAAQQQAESVITLEEVISYAIRVSERLCRRAISYYASLRNTRASAAERSQRRSALCQDLRNWDLNNGYSLETSFEQEVIIRALHNWIHFADMWQQEPQDIVRGLEHRR